MKKPDQPLYSTRLSEYYSAQDLYVGAAAEFNRHRFILIDADAYAFEYMERHAEEVRFRPKCKYCILPFMCTVHSRNQCISVHI